MLSVIISLLVALGVGFGCGMSEIFGWGWSVFFGILAFALMQGIGGFFIQRKVKVLMNEIQGTLMAGQKKLQAKVASWQMRPPGSIQAAQAEMAREQKVFVTEALAITEQLHKFDLWVPMMKRQIATAQFQLYWMIKDFKKVDELMPRVMFIDPTMCAMKIARMHMTNQPIEAIAKVYEKSVRRLRYNQNVLIAAAYSWILVQRNDVDGAFKALNRALEKSDNATLKANQQSLANNRVAHFTNSGLGDQWYSLLLEEPKIHQQRQRMQWR